MASICYCFFKAIDSRVTVKSGRALTSNKRKILLSLNLFLMVKLRMVRVFLSSFNYDLVLKEK